MRKWVVQSRDQGRLGYTLADTVEDAWAKLVAIMRAQRAMISPFDTLTIAAEMGHEVGDGCRCQVCEAYRRKCEDWDKLAEENVTLTKATEHGSDDLSKGILGIKIHRIR